MVTALAGEHPEFLSELIPQGDPRLVDVHQVRVRSVDRIIAIILSAQADQCYRLPRPILTKACASAWHVASL